MGLFKRSSSRKDEPIQVGRLDPSVNPMKHEKTRSYDIHDPVLTAIRDEEPFQMSANTQPNVSTVSPDLQIRDIFGEVISSPDRSNPTRPRDERPLDTIRGFEYLCTGDDRLREEMETNRYGWNPRPNFMGAMPHFDSNPYASNNNEGMDSSSTPRNMVSFGNGSSSESAGNAPFKTYDPNASQPKKKRGLFGRKKKN